jgi:hypothetical protein
MVLNAFDQIIMKGGDVMFWLWFDDLCEMHNILMLNDYTIDIWIQGPDDPYRVP